MEPREHLTLIGVLHLVFSGFGAVLSLLFLFAVVVALAEHGGPDLGTAIVAGIAALLLLLQVPGVVVGIGLLTRRGWARTGGLILAACYLLALPFGTAFGIYGIYILERPEVRALFRQDEAPGLGRPDPSWT